MESLTIPDAVERFDCRGCFCIRRFGRRWTFCQNRRSEKAASPCRYRNFTTKLESVSCQDIIPILLVYLLVHVCHRHPRSTGPFRFTSVLLYTAAVHKNPASAFCSEVTGVRCAGCCCNEWLTLKVTPIGRRLFLTGSEPDGIQTRQPAPAVTQTKSSHRGIIIKTASFSNSWQPVSAVWKPRAVLLFWQQRLEPQTVCRLVWCEAPALCKTTKNLCL